jgi:hypothetical protein
MCDFLWFCDLVHSRGAACSALWGRGRFQREKGSEGKRHMEIHTLEEVDKPVAELQEQVETELLARDNVVGVGVGRKIRALCDTGEPCLTVFVSRKVPLDALKESERVPRSLKHCKTDVVEVGEIQAGEARDTRPNARRESPACGGLSVGHPAGSAGTLGAAAIDRDAYPGMPPRYYLLSSNHVLAHANAATLGDPVLQPAPADGGAAPSDVIGHLARYVRLSFDGEPNFVDAAVAEVAFDAIDRRIHWIGFAREASARVRIGQLLQKTGRSSGYTTGLVQAVNVSLTVEYPGKTALFVRQIIAAKLSMPGDSGSVVLDMQTRPVGLLFAASERVSVLNPIGYVESLLAIKVGF